MELNGIVYLISRFWWEETQKNKRNPKISKIRSKLRQLEVSEGKYSLYMFTVSWFQSMRNKKYYVKEYTTK